MYRAIVKKKLATKLAAKLAIELSLGVSLSLFVLLSNLSGCQYITGGSDNSEPPMALSTIEPSKSFEKLWSMKTGGGSYASYLKFKPLLLDDKIITVDAKGALQATDNKNGSLIWQQKLNKKITQGIGGNSNKIFVGTGDGTLLALDPNNGKELWQKDLSKNILNNPFYDGKNIYLQSTDGTLYSLSPANGKLNWEYKSLVPDLTLYSTSSPIVWKNTVIAGFSNGKIVSFDKVSGMPNWDYQVATPVGSSSISRMVDINAEPVILDDILYAVSYQGNIVALDLASGKELWKNKLSAINNIAVNHSYLFVSDTNGTVWALNRSSGRVLWQQPNLHARDLSGTSYAENTVLVGDYEGYIHGLAPDSGGFIARTKLSNSGIIVAPQVKDGIIYILDNSGYLAAYKLNNSLA